MSEEEVSLVVTEDDIFANALKKLVLAVAQPVTVGDSRVFICQATGATSDKYFTLCNKGCFHSLPAIVAFINHQTSLNDEEKEIIAEKLKEQYSVTHLPIVKPLSQLDVYGGLDTFAIWHTEDMDRWCQLPPTGTIADFTKSGKPARKRKRVVRKKPTDQKLPSGVHKVGVRANGKYYFKPLQNSKDVTKLLRKLHKDSADGRFTVALRTDAALVIGNSWRQGDERNNAAANFLVKEVTAVEEGKGFIGDALVFCAKQVSMPFQSSA